MAIIIKDQNNFKTEVLESEIPVLVDFFATWCGPCKMLAPVIDQIASEYEGKVKVCKVDVDECREPAMEYGITSIPTLILFKGGKAVKTSLGFMPKPAVAKMIDENV